MTKKTLSYLISLLKKAIQDEQNWESAFDIVGEISTLKDFKSIYFLLRLLSDDSEDLHLMWSIVHAMEIFEDQVYVREILDSSSYLVQKAPEWASVIFMRILNSDSDKQELIRQLKDSPLPTKSSVKKIMEIINNDDLQFLDKTNPVIVATSL